MVGVFLVILLIGLFIIARGASAPLPSRTVVDLTALTFDVADTDALRRQGLSGRASLAPFDGMRFVFGASGIYPFWMKDMTFPIDIVWLDNGIVVDVVTLPPPSNGAIPVTHIPTHAADEVLEFPAGRAAAMDLRPGTRVILPR
ncbi:DUF192 domain-containing protein [Candidatus Uhrbacteria bacterium]|nr:DUF192 domain-containing protein [Candidatus Uhrbacteria bacterium]